MLAPRLMLSPNMLRHCLVSVPSRAGHTGDLKGKPSGGSKPKRAERGLYGGKVIQSGNNVSFSINRNKRTWKPNVHSQSLFSELLGCKLTFRTTTHALRTIDKYGGIDNYLLKTPDGKLDSDVAVSTKRLLEATIVQQQARAAEKAAGSPMVTPGWTEEEELRLAQLCEKGNYGKKDWGYKAMLLGTGRTADAVRLRWRTKVSPRAQEQDVMSRHLKLDRAEQRLELLQQRTSCTRRQALHALRRNGVPGARYGRWGLEGDVLVGRATEAIKLACQEES